jgi:hypothetical protein
MKMKMINMHLILIHLNIQHMKTMIILVKYCNFFIENTIKTFREIQNPHRLGVRIGFFILGGGLIVFDGCSILGRFWILLIFSMIVRICASTHHTLPANCPSIFNNGLVINRIIILLIL